MSFFSLLSLCLPITNGIVSSHFVQRYDTYFHTAYWWVLGAYALYCLILIMVGKLDGATKYKFLSFFSSDIIKCVTLVLVVNIIADTATLNVENLIFNLAYNIFSIFSVYILNYNSNPKRSLTWFLVVSFTFNNTVDLCYYLWTNIVFQPSLAVNMETISSRTVLVLTILEEYLLIKFSVKKLYDIEKDVFLLRLDDIQIE